MYDRTVIRSIWDNSMWTHQYHIEGVSKDKMVAHSSHCCLVYTVERSGNTGGTSSTDSCVKAVAYGMCSEEFLINLRH